MGNFSVLPIQKHSPSVDINSYDYRAICLFFACLFYGIWGRPTPDILGIPEILIGVLLVLSIGIGNAYNAVIQPSFGREKRFWKSSGQIFIIYGLTIPIGIAAFSSVTIFAMIRDLIPFLFLFLPLFLLPTIRARPYYFRSIVVAIILIGLLFSLRSLIMRYEVKCAECHTELLYLENMPTVLFFCLFLIGCALNTLIKGITLYRIGIFFALITVALLPMAAMAVTLQRASLGAVILYILILMLYYAYRAPYKAIWLCIIGAFALYLVQLFFAPVLGLLWDKTDKVGLNMRPQEFMAVWSVVTHNPVSFLFGIGWGGHFVSPAVGGLSVNFTHNFFSSILLKSGIVGIIFCIAYILGLFERLSRVILKNPVFGLAITAPILIDLTLYASFKSLDFGLMLLLISGSLVYFRDFKSNEPR